MPGQPNHLSGERAHSIGELTREFGVTARTLRFYEERGLLRPRRAGQRRLYDRGDRTRLKLILRGRRLGFSLDEIEEIVSLYEAPQGEAGQLQLLLDRIAERRAELEEKRRDIAAVLRDLARVEAGCLERLDELGQKSAGTKRGGRA